MSHHKVILLLGSNLGETAGNINKALVAVENRIGTIETKTEMIFTDAVEFDSNNIFCNIAVLTKTQFSPIKLLKLIKQIEVEMGRKKDSSIDEGYSDRIIDIDIVRYDNIIYESGNLKIPHYKHLYQREFSQFLLTSLSKH